MCKLISPCVQSAKSWNFAKKMSFYRFGSSDPYRSKDANSSFPCWFRIGERRMFTSFKWDRPELTNRSTDYVHSRFHQRYNRYLLLTRIFSPFVVCIFKYYILTLSIRKPLNRQNLICMSNLIPLWLLSEGRGAISNHSLLFCQFNKAKKGRPESYQDETFFCYVFPNHRHYHNFLVTHRNIHIP